MIRKTLALYAATGAALCAVLTACGSPEAPEGPELPPQTATASAEPRPDATHPDRSTDRPDFTVEIVEMIWAEMTAETQMELCMSFSIMTHDEIVEYMNRDMTAEDREMLNWDTGVTLFQEKCDTGAFSTENL